MSISEEMNYEIENELSLTKRKQNWMIFENLTKTFLHPVFTIFLITTIIFVSLFLIKGISYGSILDSWGAGLKSHFSHAMEFMLLMILGYSLAITPIFLKLVRNISIIFTTERRAVIGIVIFSTLLSWLNWALGVVGGVCLAQSIALNHQSNGKNINYPLLITAALSGLITGESGLSGNVLLFMTRVTTNDLPLVDLGDSMFSSLNIFSNILLTLSIIIVLTLQTGKKNNDNISESKFTFSTNDSKSKCLAEKVENSQLISLLFGVIGLYYIFLYFRNGGIMNLRTYLIVLISLGILLRKSPLTYQSDVISSASFAWIFFFPVIFSGSLHSLFNMDIENSILIQFMESVTTKSTFLPVNMLLSVVYNFILPNSGAGWIVAGDSIISVGNEYNISPVLSILSFSYGAGIAKILNVFIITPFLSLVNLKYLSIIKYTTLVAAVSTLLYIVLFVVFI